MKTRFEFGLPLSRAYKDSEGNMHVVGVVSDTLPDFHDDRMSERAVRQMAEQASKGELPLLDNHRSTFGFGRTFEGRTTRKGKALELQIDFELDGKYPEAVDLFSEVLSGKTKKQLSIGGMLNLENPKAVRFEEDKKSGRLIRVIDDIQLEHVAATRPQHAANDRTGFLAAVVKDLLGDRRETKERGDMNDEKQVPAAAGNLVNDPATDGSTGKAAAASDPAEDATHGLSLLTRLGSLLRGGFPAKAAGDSVEDPETTEQDSPESVKALEEAFARVCDEGELSEKARFDLQRMLTLMQRFLGEPDAAGSGDPPAGEEPAHAGVVEEVTRRISDETNRLEKTVRALFDETLLKSFSELGAVLEAIRKDAGATGTELTGALQALQERVQRMEKVAGVRQTTDGQEDPSKVTKAGNQQNPFRGIFGKALEDAGIQKVVSGQ